MTGLFHAGAVALLLVALPAAPAGAQERERDSASSERCDCQRDDWRSGRTLGTRGWRPGYRPMREWFWRQPTDWLSPWRSWGPRFRMELNVPRGLPGVRRHDIAPLRGFDRRGVSGWPRRPGRWGRYVEI